MLNKIASRRSTTERLQSRFNCAEQILTGGCLSQHRRSTLPECPFAQFVVIPGKKYCGGNQVIHLRKSVVNVQSAQTWHLQIKDETGSLLLGIAGEKRLRRRKRQAPTAKRSDEVFQGFAERIACVNDCDKRNWGRLRRSHFISTLRQVPTHPQLD